MDLIFSGGGNVNETLYIVVWSLFSIWRLFFSLRLVEFSIYSHAIKIIFPFFYMFHIT